MHRDQERPFRARVRFRQGHYYDGLSPRVERLAGENYGRSNFSSFRPGLGIKVEPVDFPAVHGVVSSNFSQYRISRFNFLELLTRSAVFSFFASAARQPELSE